MNRRPLAALSAALVLFAADAAGAVEAPPPGDRELAAEAVKWMGEVFAVPDSPDLDAGLRDAMSKLAAEHLARLARQLPAWLAETRQRAGPQVTRGELVRQTRNRLLNEIALWRLDSPGAAYDAVWLKAVLKPAACYSAGRNSYLGRVMTWLQAVPLADRATALAGERELLSRWGQPRTHLAARPARSLSDDEDAAIARLQAGLAAPDVPMPPVVAARAFAAERQAVHGYEQCALHQWGLAHALSRGDSPATGLAAWRYAMLMTADDWSDRPPATSAEVQAADGWPPVALASGLHGTITVRVTTDAQGRFASGEIVERRLTVPGVTGEPAVAYETLLDTATLAKAAATFKPVALPEGRASGVVDLHMNWTLK